MPRLRPGQCVDACTRGFHACRMGWVNIRIGLSRWLAAACIVAIAGLGFAHERADAARPAAIDLAAYALPDGTLPSLCATGSDDFPSGDGRRAALLCGLCLLIAAPGLPPPAEAAKAVEQGGDAVPDLNASAGPVRSAGSSHVPHLRGPPRAIEA